MTASATIFVVLAALLHIVIFGMESVGWTRPSIWRRFNVVDQAQAGATRQLAFNQGFYNLFLAVLAALGAVLVWTGHTTVGWTLAIAATASMVAASLVLSTLGRAFLQAALTQGAIPAVALVLSLLAVR